MKIQRRWNYFVYCALRDKGLCTVVDKTYEEKVRENGTVSKTIVIEYEDTDEVKAAINAAFEARGLKREAKPATVQPEVKAAEVKEEIVEETEMSAMFTAEQVAALVLAASKGTVPATQVVTKEVVPADYETLKKTAATWQSKYVELEKKYNALVASMKEAKPVEKDTLVKAINEPMSEEEKTAWNIPEKKDDSPFDEKFCEANKAFKEEVKKEEKREDCLFGDDFVFSTDYITQIRTLQNILGYTGALLNKTKLACEWNRDKKVSFTNGYEFVAAITKLAIPSDMWKEVVTGLTTEREGTNIVSKNVRAQLKAYYEEGLSKKEIGEVMSMVE